MTQTHPPYLTDDEVNTICEPLRAGYAQRRHLASQGMVVKTKPNGRPLIARGEFERVMIGRQVEATPHGTQPNVLALMALVNKRKNGTHK